jgi:S-adenosylmethionine hydrolase
LNGVTRTYGDASPGTWLALIGSSGRLEISIREGSARSAIGPGAAIRGMPVVVEVSPAS